MTTYTYEHRTKDDFSVREPDEIKYRKTTVHFNNDKSLIIIQNDDMIHLSHTQVLQLKATLNWEYL